MDKQWLIKRLDSLRKERGWSKCRLNEEAGLSAGMIYQWYNTDRMPTIQNLEAICKACGISLSKFFADEETELAEINRSELIHFMNSLSDADLNNVWSILLKIKEFQVR